MAGNKEGQADQPRWISFAALTSAILAVCAALSGLSSTYHGNTVTRELIRNTNQWSYYQAKGIKANLLQTRLELLSHKKTAEFQSDLEKLREYKLEQDKIAEKAKEQEDSIHFHVKVGGLYSKSLTLFQIAIGIVAVSLLTRRKVFWFGGLGLASYGIFFSVQAILLTL